jgi:hypothetical protein
MPEVTTWGATVDEVSAFVPHIGLTTSSTVPEEPVDDVFGETPDGKVSREQVQKWIEDVAARIEIRLIKFGRIIPETSVRTVLTRACHDLTVTGAAAYLVAAAFPAGASVNPGSSYEILWGRFEAGLDDLALQLDAIVTEGDSTVVLPRIVRGGAASSFPSQLFADGQRW